MSRRRKPSFLSQPGHPYDFGSNSKIPRPTYNNNQRSQDSRQRFHYVNNEYEYGCSDAQQWPHNRYYSGINENSYQNRHIPGEYSYPYYQNSQQTFHDVHYPNYHNQFPENVNLDVQEGLHDLNYGSQERNTVNRKKRGNDCKQSTPCVCKTDKTRQKEGVDNIGILYQYSVVTYEAICLSKNSAVEEYVIFSNPECINYIDDLIVKVKIKGEFHLYFFQMKHSYKEADISKTKNCDFKNYKEEFVRIIKKMDEERNKCLVLKDVKKENMHFFFYSNHTLNKEGSNIKIGDINCDIKKDIDVQQNECYRATLPKEMLEKCFKLVPCTKVDEDEDLSLFLVNTRLFLNQPHVKDISGNIMKFHDNELSDKIVTKLVNNIREYFRINTTPIMTSEAFETELLRIRLSGNIEEILPQKISEMNIEQVQKWNEFTSSHDVVLVEDVKGIKTALYCCILQKISDFLMDDSEREKEIKKQCILPNDVINKFIEHVQKDKEKIHWIDETNSLGTVQEEMWRDYNIPLLLNKKTDITILNKFQHLNKKFILLYDVEEKDVVMQVLDMNVFSSVADIENQNKRTEFLRGIQISLQGRKPVSLEDIIGTDEHCMKKLKSTEVLQFIKKKSDVYLDERSFESIENMAIIKEVPNLKDEGQELLNANNNILINCHSSNVDAKKEEIETSPKYRKYPVYHLKLSEKKLKFESGNKTKVKAFLVDEDGNHVFTASESDECVAVIGDHLGNHKDAYIPRKLRRSIINTSIFDSKPKVYFLTGELESLDDQIRNKIIEKIEESGTLDEFLQEKRKLVNSSLVYHVTDFLGISHFVNDKDFPKTCPVVFMNVSIGKLVLLNYKNCNDLDSYISYAIISENVFSDSNSEQYFKNNPVILITGNAGMGKTALLHSLSQAYDGKCFVLFCDLMDYRKEFEQSKKIDLDVVESKCLSRESSYQKLLHAIYKYQVDSHKVLLLIDSFDEMWPIAKEKVLDFIKDVAKRNIRIIIASRTIVANVIINAIPVNNFKLVNLTREDLQNCYGYPLDDGEISTMPNEILVNPLYFNFMMRLKENLLDFTNIDRINLYKHVISMLIDEYRRKVLDIEVASLLNKHQVMALAIIFDKNFLREQEIIKDYESFVDELKLQKIKLGVIKRISDDGSPIFIHQTVAEYLAAQWLSENLFKQEDFRIQQIYERTITECDKNLQYFFDSIVCEHLPFHSAIIKGDLASVRDILSKSDENIELVDKYGRNSLHLAANYAFKVENGDILDILVNDALLKRKCALHARDTPMKWTWLDYLKFKSPAYINMSVVRKSLAALKVYNPLSSENVFDDISATLILLNDVRTYFDIFAFEETTRCGCLDIVCDLFEYYYEYDKRLGVFLRLCEHLYELKYINARLQWSEEEYCEFTLLHVACFYGHLQSVQKLLDVESDVNVTDESGLTPLHYAICGGSSEVVSALLARNYININMPIVIDEEEYTYLHIAVKYSNLDVFKLLFYYEASKNAHVNKKTRNGQTSLSVAVRLGKLDVVQFLLRHSFKYRYNALHKQDNNVHYLSAEYSELIAIKNGVGKIPSFYSSHSPSAIVTGTRIPQARNEENFRGHCTDAAKEVQLPILTQEDLNNPLSRVNDGEISADTVVETSLHSASTNDVENVYQLIPGQILDFSLPYANELFLSSVKTQNMKLLNFLLNNGLDIKNVKKPALHVAIENGNIDIIILLLDKKINTNLVDKFSRSAMHIAARKGNAEIVVLLLRNNIDLNIVNKFNETALHIAFKYENLEIVKLLVNAGINMDVVSRSKESALHYAVRMNNVRIVDLLVKRGVNENIVNEWNETALFEAIKRENTEMAKLLMKTDISITSFSNNPSYNTWAIKKLFALFAMQT